MVNKNKNTKGITLVGLVITIVVLLILAGISIQAITNTGLFTKAQQAKEETAKKEEEEQTVMNGYQDAIDQYASGISNDNGGWNSTKKVNSPRLMEGMTGVYWDETGKEVEVTSANKDNWYNYDNQKWANAKTKDGSYWVWIPRYAYQIESGCYTNIAGKISIKFLQGTSNKDSDGKEISTKYPTVTGGKILGGKTGYTSEAGHCLASFAEIEGREYIFVSAGASGADGNTIPHIQDAVTIYNRVGAAIEAKMNNENE